MSNINSRSYGEHAPTERNERGAENERREVERLGGRRPPLEPRSGDPLLPENLLGELAGFFVVVAGVETVHGSKMSTDLLLHLLQMGIALLFEVATAIVVQLEDENRQLAAVVPHLVTLFTDGLVRIQMTGIIVKLVQ